MRQIPRDAGEMPFLDHLEELRWRIIYSLGAVVVGLAVGFFIVLHFDVLNLLERPILPYLRGHHVIATHPTDGLQLIMSSGMWLGFIIASPVILYQVWMFLTPALYKHERRYLIAALGGGIVLFALGALFAYAVMLPMSLPWLFKLFGNALEPMITAENYFGFVFSMVLTFGLAFELPVLVLLLAAARLVSPQMLSRFRRHAIVLIVAVAGFLTPGDIVMSTLALAIPLYLLYELSVLVAYVIWRKRDHAAETVAVLLAPLLVVRAWSRRSAAASRA
ncbi:MAG TPA: twin-arginine translocase subunit TatC [Gemmatimonadaceae bacterium]|jgi:sec-independent protein translocase protein TatC